MKQNKIRAVNQRDIRQNTSNQAKRRKVRHRFAVIRIILVILLILSIILGAIRLVQLETRNKSLTQSQQELKEKIVELQIENTTLNSQIELLSNTNEKISNLTEEDIQNIIKEREIQKSRAVTYTEEERIMMEYIVECEAHGLSYEHKTIIACIIINRLDSDLWNYESIKQVILDKNQFSSLFNVYNKTLEPDDDTKKAVLDVLSGKVDRDKVSKEAVFFYNPNRSGGKIAWFENKELVLEMDGHRFFK